MALQWRPYTSRHGPDCKHFKTVPTVYILSQGDKPDAAKAKFAMKHYPYLSSCLTLNQMRSLPSLHESLEGWLRYAKLFEPGTPKTDIWSFGMEGIPSLRIPLQLKMIIQFIHCTAYNIDAQRWVKGPVPVLSPTTHLIRGELHTIFERKTQEAKVLPEEASKGMDTLLMCWQDNLTKLRQAQIRIAQRSINQVAKPADHLDQQELADELESAARHRECVLLRKQLHLLMELAECRKKDQKAPALRHPLPSIVRSAPFPPPFESHLGKFVILSCPANSITYTNANDEDLQRHFFGKTWARHADAARERMAKMQKRLGLVGMRPCMVKFDAENKDARMILTRSLCMPARPQIKQWGLGEIIGQVTEEIEKQHTDSQPRLEAALEYWKEMKVIFGESSILCWLNCEKRTEIPTGSSGPQVAKKFESPSHDQMVIAFMDELVRKLREQLGFLEGRLAVERESVARLERARWRARGWIQ